MGKYEQQVDLFIADVRQNGFGAFTKLAQQITQGVKEKTTGANPTPASSGYTGPGVTLTRRSASKAD